MCPRHRESCSVIISRPLPVPVPLSVPSCLRILRLGPLFAVGFIGTVFIGIVHDYLSLMVSVRNKGVSLTAVCEKAISPLARWLFGKFAWLTLIPAVFMWLETESALCYLLFWEYAPRAMHHPAKNIPLIVVSLVLIVLGGLTAGESFRSIRRNRKQKQAA